MIEESQSSERPPTLPHYPQGIPTCHPKQQGPLMKILGKMLSPKPKTRAPSRGRGLISRSTIHIGKRKQKWY
jgi:hypothetical protein